MSKRKHARSLETRDSKAEQIYATAMDIVETDAEDTRAKIERLRTLRLEKATKQPPPDEENA